MNAVISGRPPNDGWVAAIHTSEHDHQPLGSAVVVDARRVLTCAHVVLAADGLLQDPLWVSFPKITETAGDERRLVVSADLAYEPPVKDLALLILAVDVPPGVLPAPLRCPQPQDLVDRRWWAFGFPDRDPLGDDADGIIGATLARGWLRLDTSSRYLIQPGFSGGGLWSPDYEAVVAIVAQSHANGDGRAVTLHQANLSLPDQKLGRLTEWSVSSAGEAALSAWGWSLADDPEGARHWRPRARGVSVDSERGFRFRGRTRALTKITEWLDRRDPDRKVLVVTGSPGVGKSAALGRIVTTADAAIRASLPADDDAVRASPGSVACAVHAKGKAALDVATEIARAASASLPAEPAELAPMLRQALQDRGNRTFNVVIDALDEATSPEQARTIVTKIVLPLAETCSDLGAQVVVGTRRHDNDGSLLDAFGRASAVIDLDDQAYFAPADLASYALACLRLVGDERASSPYHDLGVAKPVAGRIAELSDRNFLIAGLAARDHGLHDQHAVSPGHIAFDATIEAALNGYLERVGPVGGLPASQALTALAYAEAPGLSADLWQVFIETLYDRHVRQRDLKEFARSAAANFLIETIPRNSPEPVFRLFHQAFNDTLISRRTQIHSRADDERGLTSALIDDDRHRAWENAVPYALRSLPAHAAAAGLIDDLLNDETYLLYADLHRLVLHGDQATSTTARRNLQMIGLTPQAFTARSSERAALFSVTQALEYGQVSYSNNAATPYVARWARAQPRSARAVMEGRPGWVNTLCPVTINGRDRLIAAGSDGTIRIWDPATSQQTTCLESGQREVWDMCLVAINGQSQLATSGGDGTIRIWDPATSQQTALLEGHQGAVRAMCLITINGHNQLASAGLDGTIRTWDLVTGQQTTYLETRHGAVRALCSVLVGGQGKLASTGYDGTIRIWDPGTGQQVTRLESGQGQVWAMCLVTISGRSRLATAGGDGTIRIWNLATRQQTTRLEPGQGAVRAMCLINVNGHDRLATAEDGGTIRVWDPATRRQNILEYRKGSVWVVCPVTINGHNRLASAGLDGTIRIWDPTTTQRTIRQRTRQGAVRAICPLTINGHNQLAIAGDNAAIRIWNPTTGQQTTRLDTRQKAVSAMCPLTINGHSRLVTAGLDGTIRIWDPGTRELLSSLEGHQKPLNAVCLLTINGHSQLASAGDDGTIRLWDLATGKQTTCLESRELRISSIWPITISGQNRLAAAEFDGIRIWDPVTNQQLSYMATGHGQLRAMCPLPISGHSHLATAGDDGTICIRDPVTRRRITLLEGHQDAIRAMCLIRIKGQNRLASASDDGTVRIWNPATSGCMLIIPVHNAALALASADAALSIGLSTGVLVIDLNTAIL